MKATGGGDLLPQCGNRKTKTACSVSFHESREEKSSAYPFACTEANESARECANNRMIDFTTNLIDCNPFLCVCLQCERKLSAVSTLR